jgi:hypothetical protein
MIVNGHAPITPELADEAMAQLRLRYRLSAQAAATYAEAGFTVVYQDVILGTVLQEVADMLTATPYPVAVVVLCPSPEVVAQREAARSKTGYGAWTPEMLDHGLRTETPRLGLWLDTSDLTVEQTVDAILERLADAIVRSGE